MMGLPPVANLPGLLEPLPLDHPLRGLLRASELALMKSSTYLINTERSGSSMV